MTAEQYRRWIEFSCGMARNYPGATDARRTRLFNEVRHWFECLNDEDNVWQHMISWDESDLMPDGEKRYGLYSDYPYACDMIMDLFEEAHDHHYLTKGRECKFYHQLNCCIRAGMDTAAEPSAGVLGFSVGDIRQFFGGTIPDWVNVAYETDLNLAAASEGVWL